MKFNFFLIILVVINLTGCASGCQKNCIMGFGPGNPMFDAMALSADRDDLCQGEHTTPERRRLLGRPDDYKTPDWCYTSKRKISITDRHNHTIGYIK